MAFGKSLDHAAIQPPPMRVLWNPYQHGPCMTPEKRAERSAQLEAFRRADEKRHAEKEAAFLRRIAARAAAGLTDPPPIVEPWPSMDHHALRLQDKADTQKERDTTRAWKRKVWAGRVTPNASQRLRLKHGVRDEEREYLRRTVHS